MGKEKKKGKERKGGLALAPMAAGEFDGSSFHYGGGGEGREVRACVAKWGDLCLGLRWLGELTCRATERGKERKGDTKDRVWWSLMISWFGWMGVKLHSISMNRSCAGSSPVTGVAECSGTSSPSSQQ